MLKVSLIILGICCLLKVLESWHYIREVIESQDSNIVRVRTKEEMSRRSDENAVLDFIGLVEQYDGYTAEEYEVETSDGYILKLHRVTGSPVSPAADNKPVVYVGLGLVTSSDFYAVFGPQHALLYMLADAGYDVWIGNFRGTTYSKRHVKYSATSDNQDFWQFSVDELGLIDLPLFIDTILEKTKKEKLTYIGISLSTTVSAILLSGKPEYNDKLHVVISVAPEVLFTPPYSTLMNILLAVFPSAKALAFSSKAYQILPQSKLTQIFAKNVCVTFWGRPICESFFRGFAHVDRMNKTVIPNLLNYYPAGTSIFVVDQYAQFLQSAKFQRYDYGASENMLKYGSPLPPEYNLTKVTAPHALIYSDADVFLNDRDIKTLSSTLPNVVALENVPDFNHADFVLLDEAKETVYERLLQIIQENLNE